MTPDTALVPRERQVWTKDDRKVMNRAVKMMLARHIAVVMHCTSCGEPLTREASNDGFDMLCRCTRRVFQRGL